MAAAALPLVRSFAPGAAFAYRDGRALPIEAFLSDVAQLARALPERRHVLNLCTDRYRFAVAFAAALLRVQVTLLPPNETPDVLARLESVYPDAYCLHDREQAPGTLSAMRFPDSLAGLAAAGGVPELPAAQPAVIVFTSGSTGQPVPHPKTWASLAGVARAEIEILRLGERPGLALLGTVPPQHVFGLEATVLAVMQGGLALACRRPFYPADIRAELAALPRPRALVIAPAHLRVLLAEQEDLPAADFLLSATSPLSRELALQAEARFGAELHEIYGCTESGGIASRRTTAGEEWRAMRGVKLRTDAEATWVKGGHVEAEVALADVIELRGGGRFLLHGRTADLVNIAGKRTSLAHLNYHLNSIEGVLDGVFVVPEHEGDAVIRLAAYVVAPGLSREALMAALRQRIDSAFLPRPLHFVDSLPRNETGKLPRQALAEFEAGLARRAG
jgi:acyl-coenzyme A synthetase/AMP-(fatty) acid ligase